MRKFLFLAIAAFAMISASMAHVIDDMTVRSHFADLSRLSRTCDKSLILVDFNVGQDPDALARIGKNAAELSGLRRECYRVQAVNVLTDLREPTWACPEYLASIKYWSDKGKFKPEDLKTTAAELKQLHASCYLFRAREDIEELRQGVNNTCHEILETFDESVEMGKFGLNQVPTTEAELDNFRGLCVSAMNYRTQ